MTRKRKKYGERKGKKCKNEKERERQRRQTQPIWSYPQKEKD